MKKFEGEGDAASQTNYHHYAIYVDKSTLAASS